MIEIWYHNLWQVYVMLVFMHISDAKEGLMVLFMFLWSTFLILPILKALIPNLLDLNFSFNLIFLISLPYLR